MDYFATYDTFYYDWISIQTVDNSFYINGIQVPISYIRKVIISFDSYPYFDPLTVDIILIISNDDINEFDMVFKLYIDYDEDMDYKGMLTALSNVFLNAGLTVYLNYPIKVMRDASQEG